MSRLPKSYKKFFADHPQIGAAYEAFGASVESAGPLDAKTISLVKLGVSIGAKMEGAAKSHAHKALQAGATKSEVEHVALLAAPTIGFPNMMAARGWVLEVLDSN